MHTVHAPRFGFLRHRPPVPRSKGGCCPSGAAGNAKAASQQTAFLVGLERRIARGRGAALAVLLFVGLLSGCESAGRSSGGPLANPARVPVVKVARRDLSDQLEIASELLPFQEIDVYAKVSGYVKKLYVDWGTHVKQGQLLAELEIPELQQQLLQDQAAVRRSEQDLERAHEELNRAISVYNVAHLTYTRLTNVQKTRPELVAQEEIDVSEGKDQEASAGVSAAKDSQAAAEQALLVAKATYEKDNAMYAYSRMAAPFDGVVTRIYAYAGALLPAGTSSNIGKSALCHLSQISLLRLVIPAPERAVADIRLGETVSFQVTTLNKRFEGKIARFSNQIDPETRTMHVEVNVPNPDGVLVPGMYATVQIPLRTVRQVLAAPIQAVQATSEDRGTVLVVNASNRIERREVKLGLQTATEQEIVSGLKEGEFVVFGEQSQRKAGELVAPKVIEPPTMG